VSQPVRRRHFTVLDMSRKDARTILAFNDKTGALNVDRAEIAALTAELERALHNR
jgi:hypothetical protein